MLTVRALGAAAERASLLISKVITSGSDSLARFPPRQTLAADLLRHGEAATARLAIRGKAVGQIDVKSGRETVAFGYPRKRMFGTAGQSPLAIRDRRRCETAGDEPLSRLIALCSFSSAGRGGVSERSWRYPKATRAQMTNVAQRLFRPMAGVLVALEIRG